MIGAQWVYLSNAEQKRGSAHVYAHARSWCCTYLGCLGAAEEFRRKLCVVSSVVEHGATSESWPEVVDRDERGFSMSTLRGGRAFVMMGRVKSRGWG